MKFFELKMRLVAPLVVMCCLIGVGSQVAQAQVVTNGSFETTQIPSPFLSSDPNAIPGWIHSGPVGDALLWGVGYTDGSGSITTAGDGNQFVTLGAGYNTLSPLTSDWSTTITGLTAGTTYVLTFMTATEQGPNFPNSPIFAQKMTVSFSAGSSTAPQTFTSPVSSTDYWRTWVTQHAVFVATDVSATVHFSVSNQYDDMGLDNVSVAPATTTYTSDSNVGDFSEGITTYATLSNYSATTGCPNVSFTPTSAELSTTGCRVYSGTLPTGTDGLAATVPVTSNNVTTNVPITWIEATFPSAVSTIMVFPNIDHFGSAYDGFQYAIAGSNDGVNWTPLYDATGVAGSGEPFTLGAFTGTPPASVNNVLTPQSANGGNPLPGCTGTGTPCAVGYIATFTFPTAYQYYAIGTGTFAVNAGNTDQEVSAVGAPMQVTRALALSSPTSGALLTIADSSNNILVNIYDSQIHSGSVQTVPVAKGFSNCNATDALFPTNGYVFQDGSWTGCDTGNAFEITENNTSGSAHQQPGIKDFTVPGGSFHIETHYCSVNAACSVAALNANGQLCDTTGNNICTSTDTGFVQVTNNTGAPFSGTITLTGNPVAATCPTQGTIADRVTYTVATPLALAGKVTLALTSDNSVCGGFNAPQTLTLVNGVTAIFPIGNDDYQINPFDSLQGLVGGVVTHDTLTVLPIPVPAGPLGSATFTSFPLGQYGSETPTFATSAFTAGTNFPGQACIAYSDLSAPGNPVCLELQLKCTPAAGTSSDCLTFLYTAQLDFTKDTNSLGAIGGTAFLGEHDGSPFGYNGQCPNTGFNFNLNNFFSYTATAPDPITGSGRGNSCYVGTFDPTAAPVPVGSTLTQKTFVGFQNPVSNTAMNLIKAGQAVPLIWQTFSDPAGTIPVTNLTLCQDLSGASCPTSTPWVFIGTIGISCVTDDVGTDTVPTVASGSSGLQNFGNGTYQFNMKTVKGSTGCFTTVLGFSTGQWSIGVADFKLTK